MAERPPVADHNQIITMTSTGTHAELATRALGLALVSISYQLDHVITLLEAISARKEADRE